MIRLIPDGKTDNFPAVQAYIDSLTTPGRIEFPDGDLFFSATIKVFNKSIKFIGRDYTTLIFPQGVTGLHISRDKSTPRCAIRDLNVEAIGNRLLKDRKTVGFPEAHGLLLEQTTDIDNVIVSNFGGNGVCYYGSIKSKGTRVSNSSVRLLSVHACMHGVHIDGPDANSIGFYDCDFRNNNGLGTFDSSFLGTKFYNCMYHNNKQGHTRTDNRNARSLYSGCYLEDDGSPQSVVGGYTKVEGGNDGNGWRAIHNAVINLTPKEMTTYK